MWSKENNGAKQKERGGGGGGSRLLARLSWAVYSLQSFNGTMLHWGFPSLPTLCPRNYNSIQINSYSIVLEMWLLAEFCSDHIVLDWMKTVRSLAAVVGMDDAQTAVTRHQGSGLSVVWPRQQKLFGWGEGKIALLVKALSQFFSLGPDLRYEVSPSKQRARQSSPWNWDTTHYVINSQPTLLLGMRIDKILTIPIPYRFLLIDSIPYRFSYRFLFWLLRKSEAEGELRRTSHQLRLTLAALARRHLFLINGDNKLAHIKLPAMAASGAGGNSGKTYSFKVVLLGGGLRGQDVARACRAASSEANSWGVSR